MLQLVHGVAKCIGTGFTQCFPAGIGGVTDRDRTHAETFCEADVGRHITNIDRVGGRQSELKQRFLRTQILDLVCGIARTDIGKAGCKAELPQRDVERFTAAAGDEAEREAAIAQRGEQPRNAGKGRKRMPLCAGRSKPWKTTASRSSSWKR